MTAPAQPEHDDLPDEMAKGLKAAFAGEPAAQRPSVLKRLKEKTGSKLDVHLHDDHEESDVPVRIDDEAKGLRDPTGRYQVLGEIGRGGVGVVYKGRDQDLGRDVAMKVLRPEHVSRPEIVERFVEEAQIGGQLQHPGIVPVYEIGLQAGERPYFAMKLVKGRTLAELLAQRKSADEERRRFLGIFEQVCQTIAYAHARRVVHRDLKPHNVMLGSFGEVQVVDWGFAKVLTVASEVQSPPKPSSIASVIATVRSDPKKGSHSVVGSMMGTPAYMPPEQALGDVERMDQRSDVFGLGAMLCEILTGQPPYLSEDGDLIQQAARADLQHAYERIDRCGADAVLLALCKQCLSPARQARPDSAKQVAEAVAQYLTSVEERARQAQIHAAEARVRARSTVLLSAAAVLVLALGGGGYLYLQREAQTRRDRANERVAAALNETNVRLGEARSKTPPDLALWERAADAARQAGQLADEADVTGEQRAHVGQLLATLHAEHATAIAAASRLDKDAAMQQRLLEVRSTRLDEQRSDYMEREMRRREMGFSAAFESYLDDRDLTTMDRDEAVRALSGPIAVEMAIGLDNWVASRRYLRKLDSKPPPDAEATSRLSELASTIDPDRWRNRLRAALAAKERDRDQIVALHHEADLDSLPATSMLLLASALADVGEESASQAVFERASQRFPSNFACIFELGLLHLNSGRCAQAVPCFRVAHALRPDMHEVMHVLGKALTGLGEHRAEERLFRQLAALQPEIAHWPYHVGLALMAQGRLEEAIASYQRAIEIEPKEPLTYISLSSLYLKSKKYDDAIATCRRVLEFEPQNVDVHTNLGSALGNLGRREEATAIFRRAVELSPKDGHLHYNLGNSLREQGRVEEGLAVLKQSVVLNPKDPWALDSLASAFSQLGRLDDAVANYRRAIAADPKAAGPHYNLGNALGMQNRLDDAIASYRRAIELDPNDPRFHMNLGNALRNRGDLDEAMASFRRAASLWSGRTDAEAVEWQANSARAIQGLEPRIQQQDQLLAVLRGKRESENVAELDAAATLGLARGDLQLAILAEQRAIELDPKSAILPCNLGVAFERLGRLDDAIASYERAIELAPDVSHFHVNLGIALMTKEELEDAIGCFRTAVELEPKDVRGSVLLCKALCQQRETDEAIACMRTAIELAPTNSGLRLELGVALHQAGQVDEAMACFRKAAELAPASANAHHDIGATLVRSGHPAEAVPGYRKAVELDPTNAQFHLDLGLALENSGQDDAALESYRKTVELDPKNPIANYKVGWCMQDVHRWDEAIESYRRTIESDPSHAEAHCNLAMCLQNTGRMVEALEQFRRGHELGSKRPDWRYPSAEWVRTAEIRVALEAKLPALLAGAIQPADDAERLEYITLCGIKGFHRAAVRLTSEAFAANPKLADDLGAGTRFAAAISAALAGTGRSDDAKQLDDGARARLREQAVDWLRADLDLHARKFQTGKPEDRAAVKDALRKWQREPDLACIRDLDALESLPADERAALRRLWADAADLLRSK
jgi:serine/threonine-protein kinase